VSPNPVHNAPVDVHFSPPGEAACEQPRVIIIGRPGCHLCEEAEGVVARVCLPRGIGYRIVSIEDEPDLADQYAEYIPVIMVDGQRHDFYRVDPTRLASALDR